ncbi:MAG TPA: chromosome segregation protein SMC [Streptosporangiaceae bacterium]|nr:chromosome segregation protein SMC [Streptosporangiaceae bacterium]
MYLKTLTLRGFKSFASATSMRFEPGITCVVGPNGSGKSNVVDAFSWVMGEQGVKPLRGGKMEDVVFAGTAGRPALGRAEVTLTIDNSDGALPIDYAEVTISRLLFRSGQSEYAINGDHCRLLDVQELLSDSGLGREMHVIVGQGQLDEVLNAGPEARRALIEEAAGVLKHRRRKEKAQRKLEAMQANLTRLVDLTGELGRRLKPLGRQAEIARRAAVIQADLRDARLRLLADDYVTLAAELDLRDADEAAAAAQRTQLDALLAAAQATETELDQAEQEHAPRLAAAQQAWFELSGLAERLRGVHSVAAERHRLLSAPPEPQRAGRDPDELDREAAALREQEAALGGQLSTARGQLTEAVSGRTEAEAALSALDRQLAQDARAAVTRAERLARLRGQVEAARATAAAAKDEGGRLAEALAQARTRAEHAQLQYGQVQDLASGREQGRSELAAAHEQATAELAAASARVAEQRKAEHQASGARAALRARAETLTEAVKRGADASGLLMSGESRFSGVVGAFAALLTVEEGAGEAIATALGAAAGAVAVSGLDAAAEILAGLKDADAGRADLVIAAPPNGAGHPPRTTAPGPLPDGVRMAADLVKAPGEFTPALSGLLDGVVVAADLAQAREVLRRHPGLRVVTLDGDLLGAHWARGGTAGPQSLIGLRAAAAEATAGLREADLACQHAERRLAEASDEEARARQAAAEALAGLQEADAAAAEISGRLGTLAGAAKAATDEASRLAARIAASGRGQEKDQARLAELEQQLEQAEAEADATRADQTAADLTPAQARAERERLAGLAAAARDTEMDCRLEVRTAEERLRAITGRADSLTAAAATERQARERARARAERRAREAALAQAVAAGASVAVARITESLAVADTERQAAEVASRGRGDRLKEVRGQIRLLTGELDKVVDTAHGAEIAQAARRMQLEQLATRAVEEFAVEVAELVAEYGPEVGVPQGDDAPPVPYDRAAQEKRAQSAQRLLDQLGKVNPLALEEFAALEERHAFLVTQLEDLRKTRRDLLTVIKEVDERVQQVFTEAYADTAREFERTFTVLFPGGQGQLVLTEPDDMLSTGIEFEARPPGKKVKRLSLLSGGERALTAIAFLVAIFKARPSPFYVLDEVEAALDDVNLQRLLHLFEELRESSQLIIVTHQKRTMEVADSLYGISMRGDGVSTVVSQRLRERESA